MRYARRAMLALTALGVVSVLPAAAQGATSPGWRLTHVLALSSTIDAVAATGPRDAWAAGTQCSATGSCSANPAIVVRWNGTGWKPITPPGGLGGKVPVQEAYLVAASSSANAWVFANVAGRAADYTVTQHWMGNGWDKPIAFPSSAAIDTAVTSGPRDAWAFGNTATSSQSYVVHFNGTRWARVSFPVDVSAASELSAGNIWAVGSWAGKAPKGASPIAVEHRIGSAWHTVSVPALKLPKGDTLTAWSVVADGPDDVWVTGGLSTDTFEPAGMVLLHWNGKNFTQVKVPYTLLAPAFLTGDGAGGFWLSASDYVKKTASARLFHYVGGHWTAVSVPKEPKNLTQVSAVAWIPGTRSVWAAGLQYATSGHSGQTQGVILKYGP